MSNFTQLTSSGWKEVSSDTNFEAIAKKTDTCFQFTNGKSTIVSFMPYTANASYLIKLAHSRGGSPNFFEVKASNESALVEFINNKKEEADVSNYFGLYFELQQDFDVSILAWEQWEENYK